MQLSEFVKTNTHGTIVDISGDEVLVERLVEMGVFKDQKFEYLGCAPFSGPMLIKIGSTVIAMRSEEARCLIVNS